MKWVVVSPGARDSYQVPLALAESGQLEAFVSDWYSPLDARAWRALINVVPESCLWKMRKRYCADLGSKLVSRNPGLALMAMSRSQPLQLYANRVLSIRAARRARRAGAGILCYSQCAKAAFDLLKDTGLRRVLFQFHPHPASMKKLFLDEALRFPQFAESAKSEYELRVPTEVFDSYCAEPLGADLCLAASQFTKKTLVENGVDCRKTRVIPYGVDLKYFFPPSEAPTGRLRVLFAGVLTHRKGIAFLLEAWNRLRLPNAELVCAGYGLHPCMIADGRVRVLLNVPRQEMRALFQSAHVCCVPSLAEGFGLVYLESLACGTPVIATPNTGIADLITDEKEGFVVPVRDVNAIAEKLEWCHRNRAQLSQMRAAARRLAEEYTWERFRLSVRDALHAQ